MGRIPTPKASYVAGDFVFGVDLYDDIDRAYTEFNGNISSVNLKDATGVGAANIPDGSVTSDKVADAAVTEAKLNKATSIGVKMWGFGPNYVVGTTASDNGARLVRYRGLINLSSGGSPKTFVLPIGGYDGDPAFSEAPTLCGAPIIASDATVTGMRITEKEKDQIRIVITYTSNGYGVIEFGLMGPY